MSAETYRIQQQIIRQERLIADLESQCRELEVRLSDLGVLRSRFGDVASSFESRQRSRRHALGGLAAYAATSRIASKYRCGMTELLSGSRYTHVASGLAEGSRRIERETNATRRKCESVLSEIGKARSQLEYLYRQLRLAQIAEMQQE